MKIKKEFLDGNKIIYSTDNGVLIINKIVPHDEANSFLVQDIQGILDNSKLENEILEIVKLSVKNKGEGLGSLLLKSCIEGYKESIVVLKAESLYEYEYEFNKAIEKKTFYPQLERLCNFYKKNNFEDFNDYVKYEYARAFIYKNTAGEKIIKNIAVF